MPENPAWVFASCFDRLNSQGVNVQGQSRSESWPSVFYISRRPKKDEPIAEKRRGVKVGRGEVARRISNDVNAVVRMPNHDVVIDVEIRVVEVFVLAGDQDRSTIRKYGLTLPIAHETLCGTG